MNPVITVKPSFEELSARDGALISVLERILVECDLPPDLYSRALDHYKEKTDYLKTCPVLCDYEVTLKPQGSTSTGTTVPPPTKRKGDFDVDLLIAIEANCSRFSPRNLHREIGAHLRRAYGKDLSKLRLGWQLNDAFEHRMHFDVVPAVRSHHATHGDILSATVWEENTWKETNPESYTARFNELAEKVPIFESQLIACANSAQPMLNKRAHVPKVQQMPAFNQFKKLLQRIVQLTKRHRDMWFLRCPDNGLDRKPASIVVTTILWYAYERYVIDRLFPTVTNVLQIMAAALTDEHILLRIPNRNGFEYRLPNPTLTDENLIGKWNKAENKRAVTEYFEWAKSYQIFIAALVKAEGRHILNRRLTEGLGADYVQPVLENVAAEVAPGAPSRPGFGYVPSIGIVAASAASAMPLPLHTNHGKL